MTIHWCGTGLSAIPGLRSLIADGHKITVWNRTVDKAREAVGDIAEDIRAFDLDAVAEATEKGDVIVSMLPADWHVPLAELAIAKGAHFVSSSDVVEKLTFLFGHVGVRVGVGLLTAAGRRTGTGGVAVCKLLDFVL